LSSPKRPRKIVEAVARKHGLTLAEMLGPRKWPIYVEARREAARELIQAIPGVSLTFIGRCLNRNHASVMNLLGRLKRNRPGVIDVRVAA
jgi:chromosomal replication initiation ATPase DnaA